jgi:hypothetical protein
MASLRKYEHIKHENYDLCHRNEKKLNQNFVLLKVASDKKFGQPKAKFKSPCVAHVIYENVDIVFIEICRIRILNVIFLKTFISTLYNASLIVTIMHRREQRFQ